MVLHAPVVNHWSEQRWLAQLGRHAAKLPWLTRDRFEIVTALRRDGIVVRDATSMFSPDVIALADRFVDQLRAARVQKSSPTVSPDDVVADPALYKWGLSDDNLNLAENYIGLPVHYRGVAVKRERADGTAASTRQWHLDPEDRRILKIIVYLIDVDDSCGPFEYVNRQSTERAVRTLHYSSGYVSDEAMAKVVSPTDWVRVTGSRLTAVFVDTSSVFHRAKPPTLTDRYSMTFSYASTRALQSYPEASLSQPALASVCDQLTLRQRRAAMAE
ncbi:hypothetical protein [Mycolicibacterium smegmatis]|uniref:hypothetical protein n=1 Tax=Mycolicibacterium smegmatis TaxID=1772 RepID=UPI0002ACFEB0|nr:hypothetical protein [Mycolicibacterium smegmatis]